jgi:hypothetical protein
MLQGKTYRRHARLTVRNLPMPGATIASACSAKLSGVTILSLLRQVATAFSHQGALGLVKAKLILLVPEMMRSNFRCPKNYHAMIFIVFTLFPDRNSLVSFLYACGE